MDIVLKPKIVVQYKAKSSQVGLRTILWLAPFWAIWAPWVSSWLARALIDGGFDVSLALLLIGFVFLTGVSTFTIIVCVQNKFLIDDAGLKFPLRCLLELHTQLERAWGELIEIRFVDSSTKSGVYMPTTEPDQMVLYFSDGCILPLFLNAFRREDLQNFVLALQSYVPELPMRPALGELNLGIAAGNTAEKALSFTQLWEDDMAGRFGSTVFVPLEPGQTLRDGQLEILGQIAFGGLSAVYLAKDRDKQLCVIKEAVVPSSADAESREKAMELFRREAQILMSLDHDRIAKVHDFFVENGRHYMRLEHIDGKDLRRFVKEKGAQREQMVLRWAIQIAEVLQYLHMRNPPIIHRDLTPDNLVLVADGSITLIDFGAANEFLGTATGTLVGKQSYISPEQFRGKASPQSDLYSLGATLYFLLTGEDPDALSESRPKILRHELSSEMDDLVAELTRMDPAERIESSSTLIERFRNLKKDPRSSTSLGV